MKYSLDYLEETLKMMFCLNKEQSNGSIDRNIPSQYPLCFMHFMDVLKRIECPEDWLTYFLMAKSTNNSKKFTRLKKGEFDGFWEPKNYRFSILQEIGKLEPKGYYYEPYCFEFPHPRYVDRTELTDSVFFLPFIDGNDQTSLHIVWPDHPKVEIANEYYCPNFSYFYLTDLRSEFINGQTKQLPSEGLSS